MKDSGKYALCFHHRLNEISPGAWNALVPQRHPFLRHEFLNAMETHACVGENFGWLPVHLAIYRDDILVAAMPLYKKLNSYGEFVFDHTWEQAWQRVGLSYFPKLVSAVPYTPATGPRILVKSGLESTCYPLALDACKALAEEMSASGMHWLFPDTNNMDFFKSRELLIRHDCQFHWHNRNYKNFDDFLNQLSSRKRKNIRRERKKIENAGIRFRRLDGHTATAKDWQDFSEFYQGLYEQKWGMATFNRDFFQSVASSLPDQTLLVLADLRGNCIAGSLMYASDSHLYGRHWGSNVQIDSLHFETCYYQGIEHCIERGIEVFEPGAQGEHKLARGFDPVITSSAHWISEPGFIDPIRRFTLLEQRSVEAYRKKMQQMSAYKETT